ncbi:hypothetical protein ACQKWADRAFT_172116 [Trichoderma austrokoningii]
MRTSALQETPSKQPLPISTAQMAPKTATNAVSSALPEQHAVAPGATGRCSAPSASQESWCCCSSFSSIVLFQNPNPILAPPSASRPRRTNLHKRIVSPDRSEKPKIQAPTIEPSHQPRPNACLSGAAVGPPISPARTPDTASTIRFQLVVARTLAGLTAAAQMRDCTLAMHMQTTAYASGTACTSLMLWIHCFQHDTCQYQYLVPRASIGTLPSGISNLHLASVSWISFNPTLTWTFWL